MIDEYYDKNRCKDKNCYICTLNYSDHTNLLKKNKIEKTKILIYKRGSVKKKKYNNLRSRYEKYFKLKKGSLPVT